ncbi:MAG: hypothetical protein KKH94_07630 [Candidatus Omnitrophica bacterium]|nr:hypothetical protein [Candidatus Omnitrophota bacterium]
MKKIQALLIALLFLVTNTLYAMAPEEIATFESIATQTVSDEDLSSPYNITGESLVNIIRGMVDFDIEGASIVYNRRTGQIFIKHTPTNHIIVEDIINKMRASSFKQVEIEARLVTVKITDFMGVGMDLGGIDITTDHSGIKYGTEIPKDDSTISSFSNFTSFVNAIDDTTYGGQFAAFASSGIWDIDVMIDALESKTEVNTLANPRLTVFNNQRAHIKIEQRQNYIAEIDSNYDTIAGAAGGANSVWYQMKTVVKQAQAGTILDVTPSVNSDGSIGLDVHPVYVTADLTNTKSITNFTGGNDFSNNMTLPVFEKQTIDTYLTIPNGGVAVLGGLITEEEENTFRKIPLLGDIPVIGKLLFGQERKQAVKYYLLIFIKAKIKEIKNS